MPVKVKTAVESRECAFYRMGLCFVYRHDDFEGTELHCVQRWSKVETEGAASYIFGTDDTNEEEEKEEGASDPVVDTPIPQQVLHAGNHAEDIAEIRGMGFSVDDDNEPAPENIPLPQENNNNSATDDGRTWGWAGIDHRKQANGLSSRTQINCLSGLALEGATMLEKRKYWLKHVPGDAIDKKMEPMEVGDCNSLPGILEGVPYDLFVMKDAGYTMKIMSTYGSLLVKDGQKDSVRNYKNAKGQNVTKKFKYTEPFANHFLYRHCCVDDHNNLRHSGISIEQTWRTHRWANLFFCIPSCNFGGQRFPRIPVLHLGFGRQNGATTIQKTARACFNQQRMAW
jgi:hypothetical protein